MAFDASANMYLIDRPLLMMAGSIADTFYMTEQCYSRATGTQNKELFLIPGATHIQTYYVPEYVNLAVNKLTEFFSHTIKSFSLSKQRLSAAVVFLVFSIPVIHDKTLNRLQIYHERTGFKNACAP